MNQYYQQQYLVRGGEGDEVPQTLVAVIYNMMRSCHVIRLSERDICSLVEEISGVYAV